MKVLYIVTAFSRSDDDVITPWLVELIHRLGARGIGVEVLAPSYRGLGTQTVRGVRVHRFRYAPSRFETLTHDQTAPDRIRERPLFAALLPGYLLSGARSAARLARSGDFALIHAFWPLPHGLLGLAARRASGRPLVCTFFGVELTWVRSQLPALAPVLRRVIRGSDRVTAISTHTADLVRELVPSADPVIIPFGAAVTPLDRSAPRRGASGYRILFVGRLVERKGVRVLLDAVRSLSAEAEPGVLLEIVGEGPERGPLEARSLAAGIQERVTFHGFVSAERLRELLCGADCLVLPAVQDSKGDVEGLGVVLLEAMSFGVPVVASRVGGITDIVEDGVTGSLVPPGDVTALAEALDHLRRDPEYASRLADAGRRKVAADFSWDSVVDRLSALYRETVAAGGG